MTLVTVERLFSGAADPEKLSTAATAAAVHLTRRGRCTSSGASPTPQGPPGPGNDNAYRDRPPGHRDGHGPKDQRTVSRCTGTGTVESAGPAGATGSDQAPILSLHRTPQRRAVVMAAFSDDPRRHILWGPTPPSPHVHSPWAWAGSRSPRRGRTRSGGEASGPEGQCQVTATVWPAVGLDQHLQCAL